MPSATMPSLAISDSGTNLRPKTPALACVPVRACSCRDGATDSSPPPCGEGLGVGVLGTALPKPLDPPPPPPPPKGGGGAGARLKPPSPAPPPPSTLSTPFLSPTHRASPHAATTSSHYVSSRTQ